MASITASVELYDRMSAPLNSIMNAMNLTIGSMRDMQSTLSSGMNTSSLDAATQAAAEAQAQLAALGDEANRTRSSQDSLNNSFNNGASSGDKLLGTIGKLVAAYASMQTVQKVIGISDELVSTTARLNTMNEAFNQINGTALETDTLVKQIYASAQNARGSFGDMAAVVAKFGNNARDAFSSQEEVVAFANLVQKQMTIAGASTQEASNAMLQLSQALGSGTLRGDELNSIFEQAPNLIQSIADYLDVPIGQIRNMASEGQLSADIVKAAMFASADEINAKFDAMPMTWGQLWTSFQNSALMAFQPVLNKINELANSPGFQNFVNSAVGSLSTLSMYALGILETIAGIASFISENWSVIQPIVMGVVAAFAAYAAISTVVAAINGIMAISAGVHAAAQALQTGATFAATAAQYGLNAALLACPITWIILLIIALIAIIFAVASAIANMTGVANSGFGVITGGINVVIQFFKNLGLTVANIALGIASAMGAVASNILTAFSNAISGVQSWFYNLLSTALSVIEGICEALNKLPFVEFDFSGISAKASEYANKAASAAANKGEYEDVGAAFQEGFSTFDAFQEGWASDAFNAGASWGDGVADSVSGFFSGGSITDLTGGVDTSMLSSDFANNVAQTAANTADTANAAGDVADSVDITSENLKYLRDIAETEAVNRFTTAEISVSMTNNNNVSSGMDIDGMVDSLSTGVLEAMEQAAEGVH